jgi:D-glycero-D-manno-heptose 1,7-bisphosphate phosphatase
MSIKTIFLDRDGVINKEINYLHKIDDFEFIDGVFEACQYLISLEYRIIVITNQSGISRGYYTEQDFQNINNWMIGQFKKNAINILDVFHCPHLPDSNCNCRKPLPGMLIKAQYKHNINMKKSWAIGDQESDIIAAISSGISNTILVKSGHKFNEENSCAKYIIDSIQQSNQIIFE